MTKPIDTLMQREMSRQEFLVTMGFGLASVMGFSGLIRLLTGKSLSTQLHGRSALGYGSSAYGGGKE
jgi:hypothetical protein